MGTKFSCSCAPLLRKAYRYDDSPWQTSRRKDGHLLRLWAEVFHVSSGTGTIKWQQVSEDLVPVNITCIQDSPEYIFHITAYNSQVDKILDVRLIQPGTRIGQASECFVYWKDAVTSDTWGLNFTSPIDAKQFKECCSPSFKFSRKASSSYSLKLDPPGKQKVKTKRKPQSTPASPSRSREPQCTCMTAEQYARLRAQDPRYRSSTLPRAQTRATETDSGVRSDKVTAATSSSSIYDNVASGKSQSMRSAGSGENIRSTRDRGLPQQADSSTMTTPSTKSMSQNHVGSQVSQGQMGDDGDEQLEKCRSEGTQAGGTLSQFQMQAMHRGKMRDHHHMLTSTRSMDYDMDLVRDPHHYGIENSFMTDMLGSNQNNIMGRRSKSLSKSSDELRESPRDLSLDSNTLKRMLKPMTSNESPATSPEMTRRRHTTSNYFNGHQSLYHQFREHYANSRSVLSDVEGTPRGHHKQMMSDRDRRSFSGSRSSHEIGRGYSTRDRGLYLELDRNGGLLPDLSPPSDNVMFDNHCYATTPSSSNGNSDLEQAASNYRSHQTPSAPVSPTSRLLQEYEMHLRNTLAKGMDAESYSLHTFEALLSQSMENLELAENLPSSAPRSPYATRRRSASGASSKSLTLPSSHRLSIDRPSSRASRDREGYYSDRNELIRERERERERERGYLSDHSGSSRCASCLGESSRAQWFHHSDGWRSGSSTFGSGSGSMSMNQASMLSHKRSAWDSLPSLRHEGSKDDSGYKSVRADSFEQRGSVLERQDSLRSELLGDRESKYGIVHQTSVESADSRLCYLTSSEMSDEDRMSLTTAVSDEEDGESLHNSPYKGKQTGSAAASFNCTGAVRKAGFLSVKKWLLRKKHQIELARKRGWKGYWVCLKGTTLLFYPCDSREGRTVEAAPKHLIIVDGAIMQPIPEHPKRDYIFCLSTAFGDAYLFQAPCQVELENWVNSIHCACAAAFARHRGKTGTLHLLQEEIFRLEKAIESDHKMKHMADLQQSVVSDPDTKQQIHAQILQWEENLERLHCEQFRLRCYMASLHNGELPNPKSLLTHVSRVTKNTLNKLGVFTVSSFHAFICARSPSLLNNLLAGRGATKKRAPMLSRSNSGSSRRGLQSNSREEPEEIFQIPVPDNQTVNIAIKEGMKVEDFLIYICHKKNLNPMEHFVRVKKRRDMADSNYFVPDPDDMIEVFLKTHEIVEVCAKILYQVELQRITLDQMWGFSVEAELIENAEKQDELCCYVSRIEEKSYAIRKGIIKGDEIMVINGAIVSDLDMMYIESVLQEEHALCMMMRSSRTEPPETGDVEALGVVPGMLRTTEAMIQSLVCPPPPSDPPTMSEEMISGLIVPAPAWSKELYSPEETDAGAAQAADAPKSTSRTNSFEIENLLKTAEQVTGICRSPQETRRSSPTGSVVSQQSQALVTPGRPLTHVEKLRKVILELVDTERAYVEHLNNLLEYYLEPLKKETFLSNAEVDDLFGNIQEIVAFQRLFLRNLEEAIESEPNFHELEHAGQFKDILFSIGSAFLSFVNHFKLYSSFCASHSKAQKVLHPNEGNQALQEFLAARNPKQQHSSTLESYLIKPIQRILKYPLLLQQLRNLTDPQTTQHLHLVEALKCMEKVAEHINEMQRIHEEYGAIFDHLFRQHQKSCKQVVDLSPTDLLYYGGVEWLNISDFLGKIKKGLELHAMCFVFKSAVVFLCKERLRQKKKIMGVSSKSTATEVEIIRYQVLIPVTEVQVRASTAKDAESHYLWELIHLKSQFHRRSEKNYVLSNSTADFRNAFLKTIRQIIRESVRNMSIPSTKSGQSNGSVSMPKPPPRDFSISSKGSTSSEDQESSQRSFPQQPPPPQQLQQHLPQEKKPLQKQQHQQGHSRHSSQTLKPRKPKPPQRHSASTVEHDPKDSDEGSSASFRSRSKTVSDAPEESQMDKTKSDHDPGTKSEGEDDSQCGTIPGKKTLGKTPHILTLSTTSTLSAGSTGSQAKLIQSSHHPENYQPSQVKDLGSPVWKPRDAAGSFGEATTLPRHKGKAGSSSAEASADRHSTTQGHGTTTRPGRSRKSIADVMMHEK